MVGVDVAEAEGAHPGGVDDPAVSDAVGDGRGRGVAPSAGHGVDASPVARCASGTSALTSVDADPECPHRDDDVPVHGSRADRRVVPVAEHHGQVEAREVARKSDGSARSVFVDEDRLDADVVGGDEVPVHEPLAGLGVRGGDDDEQAVGVGDDDPLDRVGVVRRCAAAGCAARGRARCARAALGPRDARRRGRPGR